MNRLFQTDTICRLCLRVDEKVYRLNNIHHKAFIESNIRLKQSNYVLTDNLYVCYICKALLTKSFNFMQTIWSAQKIICAILKNSNMITKRLLYCIDRQGTGLNPVTLSSVVAFCDNMKYDSSNDTSCDSNTNTDINKLDLDFKIKNEELKKQTHKQNPNMKKNQIFTHATNESKPTIICISDEDEESNKDYLDEVEVEICNNFERDNIQAESCDPLTEEYNTDAIYEPPEIKEKTIRGLKKKKQKDHSLPTNSVEVIEIDTDKNFEKKTLNVKKDDIDNDYRPESTSHLEYSDDNLYNDKGEPIMRANKKNKKISKTNIGLKRDPSLPTTSKVIKKQYVETDTDDDDDDNEKKIKQYKKDIDDDYQPDSTSHSEDSDYDSYDDNGKSIVRPKDDRVYPRQCDHCAFEVLEKRTHYRHYLINHPNIEYPYKQEKEYACSICGKLFAKNKINSHEANHTAHKIKCYLCPKVFSNMLKIRRHMIGVHPKRTFTCDYCSKIFKTRVDITRHIRIHTGSKPFKCHICGDGFAHSGNRSIHIRAKHQNEYYVAKKQKRTQKVRKNKIIPKRKSTIQESKSKEIGSTDTAIISEDGKKNLQKKQKAEIVSDINIEQRSKHYKNAEIESDDEVLARIKQRILKPELLSSKRLKKKIVA